MKVLNYGILTHNIFKSKVKLERRLCPSGLYSNKGPPPEFVFVIHGRSLFLSLNIETFSYFNWEDPSVSSQDSCSVLLWTPVMIFNIMSIKRIICVFIFLSCQVSTHPVVDTGHGHPHVVVSGLSTRICGSTFKSICLTHRLITRTTCYFVKTPDFEQSPLC